MAHWGLSMDTQVCPSCHALVPAANGNCIRCLRPLVPFGIQRQMTLKHHAVAAQTAEVSTDLTFDTPSDVAETARRPGTSLSTTRAGIIVVAFMMVAAGLSVREYFESNDRQAAGTGGSPGLQLAGAGAALRPRGEKDLGNSDAKATAPATASTDPARGTAVPLAAAPTAAPIAAPTAAPTAVPTSAPTPAPTTAPQQALPQAPPSMPEPAPLVPPPDDEIAMAAAPRPVPIDTDKRQRRAASAVRSPVSTLAARSERVATAPSPRASAPMTAPAPASAPAPAENAGCTPAMLSLGLCTTPTQVRNDK